LVPKDAKLETFEPEGIPLFNQALEAKMPQIMSKLWEHRGVKTVTVAKRVEMKPIGFVRTKAVGDEVRDRSKVSEIVIRKELTKALAGIQDFSHLFVIFWMHRTSSRERETMKVHPRGRADMPLLGVFATRTQLRPNPIGLTLVELLNVRGSTLTVRGLDAFDGTPILDIKPFDYWNTVKDVRIPEWRKRLENEGSEKREINK